MQRESTERLKTAASGCCSGGRRTRFTRRSSEGGGCTAPPRGHTAGKWKQTTQFSATEDWVFASPTRLGRLPWSYPRVWGVFQEAAEEAKVGKLATHTMRHSYRSWLDAVGTPIAVQQKLMRHADIRTTMNIYGDVVTNQESEAHSKIVGLALPRA